MVTKVQIRFIRFEGKMCVYLGGRYNLFKVIKPINKIVMLLLDISSF